jgi:hypothetical protein
MNRGKGERFLFHFFYFSVGYVGGRRGGGEWRFSEPGAGAEVTKKCLETL